MNAVYIRLLVAAAVLLLTITTARAASPAPAYVDIVITYAGQSFGFSGPLRFFEASDAGGRVGLDLTTLETPGYSPRPNIDAAELRVPGNRWQMVAFAGRRAPVTIEGTCAVETFATTENDVRVQHVYLNCVDLDV
jgi:hypothetical protein